ncbi:MAG: AraC family transcriptional regulator [Clostridia bacterium]|nr:AraC family transcriptional regulator [Clostridia bacterium]
MRDTARKNIEKIRNLVGDITEDQLRHVDCFVGDKIAMFMPVTGPCLYSISPLHTHPSYMFVLSFDNTTVVKIHGNTIRSEQGKLSALSPGIPHQELNDGFTSRYIAIFIDKELFEGELGEYINKNIVFPGEYYKAPEALLPRLRSFMIEADNNMPGQKTLLYTIGLEICHTIIRSVLNLNHAHDRVSYRLEIDKVIHYLHNNYNRRISVNELSKIANMSLSHFSRVFKKETGQSVLDYLLELRFERARKMLTHENMPITQIAMECGFGSSAYLCSGFKKRYNLSPLEYKKQFGSS